MPSPTVKRILYILPLVILAVFVVWIEVDPYHLAPQTKEDHWIENLTAIGYGVGALLFFAAAWRMPVSRSGVGRWVRTMTFAWAFVAFFCMGEEISWGQRIFHIATPQMLAQDNTQDEINVHNLQFMVDNPWITTYRGLSIYMLLGGFGIPLFARTKWGKTLLGRAYFPVLPWCYSSIWVGAYLYGKYYFAWHPVPNLVPEDAPTEIREMLVAIGTAFFGFHALVWPAEVYVGRAREMLYGADPARNRPADAAPTSPTPA